MRKQLTRLNPLAFHYLYPGAGGQIVNIENLAIGILYHNLRMLVSFVLDYDGLAQLALALFLKANRLAFDNIHKPD
jgi:hypothetical protein